MVEIPGLLIISGNGRNSGKTTIACRLIEWFRESGPTAVKITSHFHGTEAGSGLQPVKLAGGYNIFRETSAAGSKDTERMLAAGASRVYYIQCTDESRKEAFLELYGMLDHTGPLICESPSLAGEIRPGLLLFARGDDAAGTRQRAGQEKMADIVVGINHENSLKGRLAYSDNRWSVR